MSKARGLGRGFESLIPNVIDPQFDPTHNVDGRTQKVLITDVTPNIEQPRREFRVQELQDLADSIAQHGVLQPIVVVARPGGYTIVAGERRWRAAQKAGLSEIPAIIRTLDDQAQMEVALIENIQREDLSPLEMATALIKLNQQFNQTFEQIAKRIGKAHSTVANLTRLLKLPEPAKQALAKGIITEGHARQILALDDPKQQQELLDHIVRHGWNVRRAEQYVLAIKEGAVSKAAVSATLSQTPETKKLAKALKADVRIQKMAKGGRLVIRYTSDDELDRLTDQLLS